MAAEAAKISSGGVLAGGSGEAEAEAALVTMSTLTEQGILDVKQAACDRLLNTRVELKLKGKRITGGWGGVGGGRGWQGM